MLRIEIQRKENQEGLVKFLLSQFFGFGGLQRIAVLDAAVIGIYLFIYLRETEKAQQGRGMQRERESEKQGPC